MRGATPLRRAALITSGFALVGLYWNVIVGLVNAWIVNPDYSHGFLIVPLCAYFVWARRQRLAALQVRPSWAGLAIVAVSLCLFAAGQLGFVGQSRCVYGADQPQTPAEQTHPRRR